MHTSWKYPGINVRSPNISLKDDNDTPEPEKLFVHPFSNKLQPVIGQLVESEFVNSDVASPIICCGFETSYWSSNVDYGGFPES
jgi:hypothetical protein